MFFIGADVSEKSSYVYVTDGRGRKIESREIPTDKDGYRQYFKRWMNKPVRVAVEAGGHSRWIYDALKKLRISVYIVNPDKVKLIAKNKKKTDKVDAAFLAKLLRIDELPERVYVTEGDSRELRDLLRSRHQLIKSSTCLMNHLRGMLRQEGIKLKGIGQNRFTLSAGYIFVGSPAGVSFNNVYVYDIGYARIFIRSELLVWYEGRGAMVSGAKNPQEINVGFFHILNKDYSFKGSTFVGLNNGGPSEANHFSDHNDFCKNQRFDHGKSVIRVRDIIGSQKESSVPRENAEHECEVTDIKLVLNHFMKDFFLQVPLFLIRAVHNLQPSFHIITPLFPVTVGADREPPTAPTSCAITPRKTE